MRLITVVAGSDSDNDRFYLHKDCLNTDLGFMQLKNIFIQIKNMYQQKYGGEEVNKFNLEYQMKYLSHYPEQVSKILKLIMNIKITFRHHKKGPNNGQFKIISDGEVVKTADLCVREC
ncbi:MAG: hypothetical protein Ct9H90mP22_0390 [Gammaproteobacteria bacterium]|nr:MAG: hypothetical protein Ct9H90mP22_0390 [Gammaproteobacteria bacterium]